MVQRSATQHRLTLWLIILVCCLLLLLWVLPYPPHTLRAQSGNPVVFVPLNNIQQIAAGDQHTCALTISGRTLCWGEGYYGVLGNGTIADHYTPAEVTGLESGGVALAAGYLHTCALMAGGGVKCWGSNEGGQVGDGSTTQRLTPVNVSGLSSGVSAIATGGFHSCALLTDKSVQCWGYNGDGQLGDTTFDSRSTPTTVAGLANNVVAISAGHRHTCALLTNGEVFCWGENSVNQIGDNSTIDRASPTLVASVKANVLAAGYFHTCVLTTTNEVKCWGSNIFGQVGGAGASVASQLQTQLPSFTLGSALLDADELQSATHLPAEPTGLNIQATGLALGGYHTCIVTPQGSAQCWGGNWAGQLGDGTNSNQSPPVDVVGLTSGVRSLTAGLYHTCALKSDGTVYCWGMRAGGQLGTDNLLTDHIPGDVVGLANGVDLLSAGGDHTCAVLTNQLKCWGWNGFGHVGDGTFLNRQTPVDLLPTGLSSPVQSIVTGDAHTCALSQTGEVACWGRNGNGQLGDGTTLDRARPVLVTGLSSGIKAVTVGGYHTCVLTANEGVKCWGYNGNGQLGDNSKNNRLTPGDVTGLSSGVKAIVAGTNHTCAVTTSGGVTCWGWNGEGQLGDGTTQEQLAPVSVSGLSSGVDMVATGQFHTCARLLNSTIQCWGRNQEGQLGNGTITNSSTPVAVVGLNIGASAVQVGRYHTCALLQDGLQCWGWNGAGQLGDGSDIARATPVPVQGLNSGVKTLALNGGDHTCALTTSGGAKCWGWNGAGQLGKGNAWQLTPAAVIVATTATPTPTDTASPPTPTFTHTPITPTPPTPQSPTATPGPLYLAMVSNAPTPTDTPTPTPTTMIIPTGVWQRVGQGGLEVASLDLQGSQLFAGDRRGFARGGGLYSRSLDTCASQPDLGRVGSIPASALSVRFQGIQGAVATFGNKIYFTGDGGVTWQQTASEVGRPRTLTIAGGSNFYAGTEAEGIYRSTNGGASWSKQTEQPQAINTLQLNASTLWIGTDGTGVWIFTVGDQQPSERNAGLPNAGSKQVFAFAFRSANEIYLATYDGVYQGDGVNSWQPFGLQGKELLSLTLQGDQLYAGGRNQGSGVWRRPLAGGDWVQVSSPGWNDGYIVRDLRYLHECQGLLAATDDGVWVYR